LLNVKSYFSFFQLTGIGLLKNGFLLLFLRFTASKKDKKTSIEHRASRFARREKPFAP